MPCFGVCTLAPLRNHQFTWWEAVATSIWPPICDCYAGTAPLTAAVHTGWSKHGPRSVRKATPGTVVLYPTSVPILLMSLPRPGSGLTVFVLVLDDSILTHKWGLALPATCMCGKWGTNNRSYCPGMSQTLTSQWNIWPSSFRWWNISADLYEMKKSPHTARRRRTRLFQWDKDVQNCIVVNNKVKKLRYLTWHEHQGQ